MKYEASNIRKLSFNVRTEKDGELHKSILKKVQGEEFFPSMQHEVELHHYLPSEDGRKKIGYVVLMFSGVLESVDTSECPAFREGDPDEVLLTLNYFLLGPITALKPPTRKKSK